MESSVAADQKANALQKRLGHQSGGAFIIHFQHVPSGWRRLYHCQWSAVREMQDKELKPQTTHLLMLAEVLIGLDPATKKAPQQKCRRLNEEEKAADEPVVHVTEEALKSGIHGFKCDLIPIQKY